MSNDADQELISDLETSVSQKQDETNDTHTEILQTIRELHDALNTLEEREITRTQDVASWTDDAQAQLQNVRDQVDESTAVKSEAEGRLEAARARIQELENGQQGTENLGKELEAAELKTAQLERELGERDEAVAAMEETQEQLAKIESAYHEQAEAIEAGQAAKRRAAELETALEEFKSSSSADSELTEDLKSQVEQLTTAEAQAREELSALTAQREEEEASSKNSAETTAALEAEQEILREQLAAAEGQLSTLQDDAEIGRRSAAESEDELASREAALEDARGRLKELEDSHSQILPEIETLRTRAESAEESASAGAEALAEAQSALSKFEEADKRAETLSETVVTLKDQLKVAEEQASHLEEVLAQEREKSKQSVIAQQLAEALRDLEDAHVEIEGLRESKTNEESLDDVADSTPKPDSQKSARPIRTRHPESWRRMGQILVEAGVISEAQLEEALAHQHEQASMEHLGSVVVKLGLADEEVIGRAVAHQSDVEYVDVELGVVNTGTAYLITSRLAVMHTCIPLYEKDGHLVLAMENPLDLIAIEDVERASGRQVKPVVGAATKILDCIETIYDAASESV